MVIAMLYPSTISAFKYFLLAFYQMFVLCTALRILMDDSYSDGYVAPLPLIPTVEPIKLPKASKKRKRASRISRSISNDVLLDVVRGGNSTSQETLDGINP